MGVELKYTPVEDIEKIHAELSATFKSGKTQSLEWRKHQIAQMGYLIKDNVPAIEEALKQDLGRPVFESTFLEISTCIGDVAEMYKNVESWMKPSKPSFSLSFQAMRRIIYKQPKGVVLVISPFNYPLWLAIGPIVAAVGAGNAVVLKPSEQTPHVSSLLAELIPKYMDSEAVRVVNGAIAETTKLIELPWGHLFFTGSGRVGRVVAVGAAKTLTPTTLELGGKCPTIIDPHSLSEAHLMTAARRILWGKMTNAGQTCVAPDYILLIGDGEEKLVAALKKAWDEFYPDGFQPKDASCKLVTAAAYKRMDDLLSSTKGTVVVGGEKDEVNRWMGVTVISNVSKDDSLMETEIFGPLLPIFRVQSVEEAIQYVNDHDHPLALYVFTQDKAFRDLIFGRTQSGAAVANEVVIHVGTEGLPFGGVGGSGYGSHTGKAGFDTFTHERSSMDSPSWLDVALSARYPPYTTKKLNMLGNLTPSLPARPASSTAPRVVYSGVPGTQSGGNKKWYLFTVTLALVVGVLMGAPKKNEGVLVLLKERVLGLLLGRK